MESKDTMYILDRELNPWEILHYMQRGNDELYYNLHGKHTGRFMTYDDIEEVMECIREDTKKEYQAFLVPGEPLTKFEIGEKGVRVDRRGLDSLLYESVDVGSDMNSEISIQMRGFRHVPYSHGSISEDDITRRTRIDVWISNPPEKAREYRDIITQYLSMLGEAELT